MKQVWVVALLLLPAVFATNNISVAETTVTLYDGTAVVQSSMALSSQEIGNLTLILTPNAEDVEITVDEEEIECLVQAEFARCGNLSEGTHLVTLTYETAYPIADVGENTIVRYSDRLPYQANSHKLTLKLPVGYIVPRERGKDESFYISPAPTDVYSDGQRIIILWEHQGQELAISVIARKVVGPPIGWIASTGASLVLAAAVTIWFLLRERKKPKTKQVRKKTVVPTLIDNEQKVVEFLKQNGEIWQKQIQHATGFSKAKVSRIVRNLEERGVVTKTIYGNTNKIALKK